MHLLPIAAGCAGSLPALPLPVLPGSDGVARRIRQIETPGSPCPRYPALPFRKGSVSRSSSAMASPANTALHPPGIVLEVDQIRAVADGGSNDPDNLTTSCFDCNRGRLSIPLDSAPQSLRDKAAEIQDREEQLCGYCEIIDACRDRIENECWQVVHSFTPHRRAGINA